MNFALSVEQETARTNVLSWYRNSNRHKPWFYLAGFAGTGKSSVTVKIVESIKGQIMFAAPTGRAALIMRQKGCIGAQTIHSLIYKPLGTGGDKKAIERIEAEMKTLEPIADRHRQLAKELKKLMEGVKPLFNLNLDSKLREASLLVVDEISMVPENVMRDLLSFNVPILVQGDLGQLPPVKAVNFFKDIPPDFNLTQIHRQAADSPVIQLATKARLGERLEAGRYGESIVTRNREEIDGTNHEQIILGTHERRHKVNRLWRKKMGFESPTPVPGDRVICRQNNFKLGLLNGDQFMVDSYEDITENVGIIGIRNNDLQTRVTCHKEYFFHNQPPKWDRLKHENLDWSYGLTCHSVQGGQFDSVYVIDESDSFRADKKRWLYTAVSRAVNRVSILI